MEVKKKIFVSDKQCESRKDMFLKGVIDMRIDAYNAISQVYQTSKARPANKTAKTESFSDSFRISAEAKSYSTAKTAVAAAPDVRADKVAQIKAAMENGTYNVSAQDLADKLLGQSRTLAF